MDTLVTPLPSDIVSFNSKTPINIEKNEEVTMSKRKFESSNLESEIENVTKKKYMKLIELEISSDEESERKFVPNLNRNNKNSSLLLKRALNFEFTVSEDNEM